MQITVTNVTSCWHWN